MNLYGCVCAHVRMCDVILDKVFGSNRYKEVGVMMVVVVMMMLMMMVAMMIILLPKQGH